MDERKFAEIMQDREFVLAILNTKDIHTVQKLFKSRDLSLSVEELEEIGNAISDVGDKIAKIKDELTEDQLKEIAGGNKFTRRIGNIAFSGILIAGTVAACAYGYKRGGEEPSGMFKQGLHSFKEATVGTSFSEDIGNVTSRIWSGWKAGYNDLKSGR